MYEVRFFYGTDLRYYYKISAENEVFALIKAYNQLVKDYAIDDGWMPQEGARDHIYRDINPRVEIIFSK